MFTEQLFKKKACIGAYSDLWDYDSSVTQTNNISENLKFSGSPNVSLKRFWYRFYFVTFNNVQLTRKQNEFERV